MILSLIVLLAVMEKALCMIGPRSSPLEVDFFYRQQLFAELGPMPPSGRRT